MREKMKLVIGGYAQGKLNYVLQGNPENDYEIYDGILPDEKQLREGAAQGKIILINHLHGWVKTRMLQGGNPEEEIMAFLRENIESVLISDEIGNGIVPADAFERAYRERTGRILVRLAGEAGEVVRVICGIGQKIK
ncbi:MAG: bifunctional adenosylcobinamide kinase/adenosylcobinamide-phosphate guanylyltransferase [Bacteroidales bacterium]|nr:bifunctional adenosylcobinamide kinase/adenosylcobinamide-phosphate guanylyltransferase [Lachnoclostridium sp.]MCM1384250.1 bifunctional adenosylcobinamide kinase/adenosylcobinamide-phosphate guanylyltransferase [Lachnoclostridium sp.]MCM1464749.1 bifunctional adenosylcobinamide kinase/adenosylcobinamide-phosphate guanylyltransferase [Bacteroidales bacterium]